MGVSFITVSTPVNQGTVFKRPELDMHVLFHYRVEEQIPYIHFTKPVPLGLNLLILVFLFIWFYFCYTIFFFKMIG